MSLAKLICTHCGAEMNQHAFKIEYDIEDLSIIEPVFDGVLKEAHCCPECGHSELVTARA
jgi:hypothetical protein